MNRWGCVRGVAVGFLILWALIWLAGCRQVRYVPVERVRTDTAYINKIQRDSVVRYDSVYIRDKGDTVWLEKYKYAYRDKLVRDTVYVNRTDSVQVPYPVERELTRWQRFRLEVGGYAIFAVVAIVLVVVGRMVYKLKKGG